MIDGIGASLFSRVASVPRATETREHDDIQVVELDVRVTALPLEGVARQLTQVIPPGLLRWDELNRTSREFDSHFLDRLTDHQIALRPPIQLEVSDGNVTVVNEHPQKTEIEELFRSDEQLRSQLLQMDDGSRAVAAQFFDESSDEAGPAFRFVFGGRLTWKSWEEGIPHYKPQTEIVRVLGDGSIDYRDPRASNVGWHSSRPPEYDAELIEAAMRYGIYDQWTLDWAGQGLRDQAS
jgi:hypothetical protein